MTRRCPLRPTNQILIRSNICGWFETLVLFSSDKQSERAVVENAMCEMGPDKRDMLPIEEEPPSHGHGNDDMNTGTMTYRQPDDQASWVRSYVHVYSTHFFIKK